MHRRPSSPGAPRPCRRRDSSSAPPALARAAAWRRSGGLLGLALVSVLLVAMVLVVLLVVLLVLLALVVRSVMSVMLVMGGGHHGLHQGGRQRERGQGGEQVANPHDEGLLSSTERARTDGRLKGARAGYRRGRKSGSSRIGNPRRSRRIHSSATWEARSFTQSRVPHSW